MNARNHQFTIPTVASFHDRYGIPSHFPLPIVWTAGERRALDRMAAPFRAEEITRQAHDDFVRGLPVVGTFASLDWTGQEAAWKHHGFSYVTAAFASYMDGCDDEPAYMAAESYVPAMCAR